MTVLVDPVSQFVLLTLGYAQEFDPLDQDVSFDETFTQESLRKVMVLPSACRKFGDNTIVRLKTESTGRFGIQRFEVHEPLAPAGWQDRRRHAHALCVVAVRLVECRQLANGSVDLISLLVGWVVEECEVSLDRSRRLCGQALVTYRAEDCLTSDNEDVMLADDRLTRPAIRVRAALVSRRRATVDFAKCAQYTATLLVGQYSGER